MAKRVVDVLVPVALDQAYSYRVPDGLALAPGDVVCVPLGNRAATAVVWAENPSPNPRLDNRMKDVEEKLDVPPLKPELRNFVDWVSHIRSRPRGMVLRMALRMGEHLGPARERVGVRLAGPPPKRHDRGARARARAARRRARARQERCRRRKPASRAGVIDGLVDEGTLESLVLPPRAGGACPRSRIFRRPTSRRRNAQAADALRASVAKGGYGVTLLDGVTGSGKTQVYFEAVGEVIRRGQAGAGPAAGDRPDHAIPRPLHRALRHAPGRVALAVVAALARAHLERGCRRRGERDRRARARRCSCPMPISGSSSSMRSMIPPTSRRTARATTPATWRWCARAAPTSRSCWCRRRPRSRPR